MKSLSDLAPALEAASDLAVRILRHRPELARTVLASPRAQQPKSPSQFAWDERALRRGSGRLDLEAFQRRLTRYKYRELLRILLRHVVARAPMAELGVELTALAEAIVRAALAWAEQQLQARYGRPNPDGFCVLGLGKLGGEDLNFSSDIDLIYLYRGKGQTSGGASAPVDNATYFTRLGELLTRVLSASAPEGFLYRVDLNLRPHGRAGAIVLGLAAMRTYYEGYGRTWERAALLKARTIAGDTSLGAEFLELVEPFVWRKAADLAVVDGLRDLKQQIDLRSKASTDDVKLGPGGIREIEFFVNALQLLHGGRTPALRERNTLRALRRLEQSGFVSARDADALEEAYLFLRRLENHLQLVDERQTQRPPAAAEDRDRLARALGFGGWEQVEAPLDRHRAFVRQAFQTLLGQAAQGTLADDPQLALALDPDAAEAERAAALAGRGFEAPARALAALERLARVRQSPFRQGAPGLAGVRLLAEVARTPEPDQALFFLSELFGSLSSPQSYFQLLEQLPPVARRLLNVFGQSEYLARSFLRNPELVDTLVQPADAQKAPERIREELLARALRIEDPELRLGSLRRFKNEEVLRVGLADISGELDVAGVARQLTAVADATLEQVLFLAEREVRAHYDLAPQDAAQGALAVVAMGKLGGYELGYHSDLDLLFVYAGESTEEIGSGARAALSRHEYFAKVVQRLLTYLQIQLREGYLYKIDTRLRPSGNQGPLVVSEEALREHHQKHAQLWERQALLRARAVCGDAPLTQRLDRQLLPQLLWERPLPPDAGAEIDRLRRRMEKEVADESADQLNAKVGRGGLVDVEFVVQYLQLLHGAAHPALRQTNTLAAVEQLRRAGLVTPADAQLLTQGYNFHRRVENRLRLVHGYSLSHLPTRGRGLELLARRLGYVGAAPGQELLSEYRAISARVRVLYDRIFRAP